MFIYLKSNSKISEKVEKIVMNEDIFEEMRQRLNCEYISDLRNLKKEVFQEMKKVCLNKYTKKQSNDFSLYIFDLNYMELVKSMKY